MGLAGLTILLVEDHGFQRRLGLRLLGDLGLKHLHEAADGFQALDLLRNTLLAPPGTGLLEKHSLQAFEDALLLYSEALTSDVVIGLTVVLGGVILVVSGESLRSRSTKPVPETEVT